eukprot:6528285-Prymnesium_polylepis.1
MLVAPPSAPRPWHPARSPHPSRPMPTPREALGLPLGPSFLHAPPRARMPGREPHNAGPPSPNALPLLVCAHSLRRGRVHEQPQRVAEHRRAVEQLVVAEDVRVGPLEALGNQPQRIPAHAPRLTRVSRGEGRVGGGVHRCGCVVFAIRVGVAVGGCRCLSLAVCACVVLGQRAHGRRSHAPQRQPQRVMGSLAPEGGEEQAHLRRERQDKRQEELALRRDAAGGDADAHEDARREVGEEQPP